MSTDPKPRPVEPGEFDPDAQRPPIFEGLTIEMCRDMSPAEKWERMEIAFGQVRAMHRAWYLVRFPDASDFEIRCEWGRVTGCAAVLARDQKDRAEREADLPFVVETKGHAGV